MPRAQFGTMGDFPGAEVTLFSGRADRTCHAQPGSQAGRIEPSMTELIKASRAGRGIRSNQAGDVSTG